MSLNELCDLIMKQRILIIKITDELEPCQGCSLSNALQYNKIVLLTSN